MIYQPKKPHDRDRLANAAHRFARISPNDPVKLFTLLYKLDIGFFRETGRSCTGEVYFAMADGPAPGTLRPLLVMRDHDLHAAITKLTSVEYQEPWNFNAKVFCDRGLKILAELENGHRDTASRDLSLDDGNAWWRVYNKSKGVGAIIPYEMTLPGGFPEVAEKEAGRRDLLLPGFRRGDASPLNRLGLMKTSSVPE